MKDDNFTVRQHFVPQSYLAAFSPNESSLYRFDLNSCTTKNIPISIASIAFKKNLYEMRNADGSFISRNFVENQFCKFEGEFVKRRNELVERIKYINKEQNVIQHFINEKEQIFWTIIAALQILRNPHMLKLANILLRNIMDVDISEEAAHADILGASFPFFDDSGIENTQLYTLLLKSFYPMKMFVGISHGNHIITSDNPVYCCQSSDGSLTFREVYFPLTSNIVLFFIKQTALPPDKGHALFMMDQRVIDRVNDNIVFASFNEIYSYHPFSDEQKSEILEIENSQMKQRFIKQRDSLINVELH